MSGTDGGGEGRLARWSKRKAQSRAGGTLPEEPEETSESSAPAPVAGGRKAPVMLPLGDPEEGETGMDAAPPDALALLKRQRDGELPEEVPERTEEEEMASLTPEQREAAADLPPIESLDKNSDFTPFFAENVPEFLKRQAYRVLWRSNPYFAFQDGLNDYDEDFSLSNLVVKSLGSAPGAGKETIEKAVKKAGRGKAKADAEAAGDGAPPEAAEDDDALGEAEDDDLGDAEDDFEPGRA